MCQDSQPPSSMANFNLLGVGPFGGVFKKFLDYRNTSSRYPGGGLQKTSRVGDTGRTPGVEPPLKQTFPLAMGVPRAKKPAIRIRRGFPLFWGLAPFYFRMIRLWPSRGDAAFPGPQRGCRLFPSELQGKPFFCDGFGRTMVNSYPFLKPGAHRTYLQKSIWPDRPVWGVGCCLGSTPGFFPKNEGELPPIESIFLGHWNSDLEKEPLFFP